MSGLNNCTTEGAGEGAGVNFFRAGLDSESKTLDSDHLWMILTSAG